MKKQNPHSYKPVPLSDTNHIAVSKKKTPETAPQQDEFPEELARFFSVVFLFFFLFLFFFVSLLSFLCYSPHKYIKYHYFPHYEANHPTKKAGGGRDWLVNAGKGTIHSKHNASLVLGVSTTFPLVLVKKGTPHQLTFGPPPKNNDTFVPFQDVSNGLGFVIGPGERICCLASGTPYRQVSLSFNDESEALVSLQQDNFIVMENVPTNYEENKWTLDVQDWIIKEGQAVRFVDDSSPKSGGGRDFYWEADGIISTKLNPSLVLGRAGPKLVLVEESSPNKLVLDHVQELANGEKVVPMTWAEEGVAVGKRYNDTREYGSWYYIESEVKMDSLDEAIDIWYDGNFIFVDGEESLVFDVQFWELEPGTPVNFVGGDEETSQSNQDKEKPSLRAWSTPTESIVTSSTSEESPSSSLEGERPPPPTSTSSSSSSGSSLSSSSSSSSKSSSSSSSSEDSSSSSSSSSSDESRSASKSSRSGSSSSFKLNEKGTSSSSKSSDSGSASSFKSTESGSSSSSKLSEKGSAASSSSSSESSSSSFSSSSSESGSSSSKSSEKGPFSSLSKSSKSGSASSIESSSSSSFRISKIETIH